MRQEIPDRVGMTMQLAKDEVEDLDERLEEDTVRERVRHTLASLEQHGREEQIRQLSGRYEVVARTEHGPDV